MQPLQLHKSRVRSDWIDYNGHMNDGYYVVAFTYATDALQDQVGLDKTYRKTSGCSIYTVEAHVQYIKEVKVNAALHFSTYVLGADHKRLHLLHAMYNADEGYMAASHELMLLHVDQRLGKTKPMPAAIQRRLEDLSEQHSKLTLPAETGRAIHAVAEFS